MFGKKKTTNYVAVQLSELEQEKINACILVQALEFQRKADRIENKKKALTFVESKKLDELKQRSEYYGALAKKISDAPLVIGERKIGTRKVSSSKKDEASSKSKTAISNKTIIKNPQKKK